MTEVYSVNLDRYSTFHLFPVDPQCLVHSSGEDGHRIRAESHTRHRRLEKYYLVSGK